MSLGAPLGLLGLLALPALVGLYFLRRRQPPRTVSALFLWSSLDARAEAGPRLERFSREASLLLELAAALAATGYLADLRLGAAAVEKHSVLVLDGSLSMSARLPSGRTVAEEALAQARRCVDEDAGRVTVIESGARPRILAGPGAPRSQMDALAWTPAGPGHDFALAWSLARELAGPRSRIRFFTDKPLEPAPEGIEVLALGAPLDNDAFVAAARVDQAGKARVALRVVHFGRGKAEIPVELRTEAGETLRVERVSLGPGEETAMRVELAYGGPIVAALPKDALPADGLLTLLPQPTRALKVRIQLGAGPADESLRRFVAAEGAASVDEPADLIFVSPGGQGLLSPWTVVVGSAGRMRTLAGPFFAQVRHRLLDAVPLDGLLWTAGDPSRGVPLLTAGEEMLVSEEPGPVFHINVDMSRSNLQRAAAWPVLLANLFALRREAMPGFARRDAVLGETVAASFDAQARWTLEGPPGSVAQVLRTTGTVQLPMRGGPGRYRLLRDGKPFDELEVLPIDRGESDLRDRASGRSPSPLPIGSLGIERPRSIVWLFLFAVLLGLDWLVAAWGRIARSAHSPV